MQPRQPRLGDILDDYCPRERRVTNHAVVAMIGPDVKQTRCTTCDAEHEYKHAKVPRQRRKAETPAALYTQVLASGPKRVAHEEGANNDNGSHTSTGTAHGSDEIKTADSRETVGNARESLGAVRTAGQAIEPAKTQGESIEPAETAGASSGPAEKVGESIEPVVKAGESVEPGNESTAPGQKDSGETTEKEEGPVHRPLIRASLPRPEGQPPPSRPIPEFTIRQPGGRPGSRFRPRHQRGGQQGQQFGGNRGNGNFAGGPPRGMRSGNGGRPQGAMPMGRRHGGGGRKRSK